MSEVDPLVGDVVSAEGGEHWPGWSGRWEEGRGEREVSKGGEVEDGRAGAGAEEETHGQTAR